MQNIKSSILRHVRVEANLKRWIWSSFSDNMLSKYNYSRLFCTGVTNTNIPDPDQAKVMERVIGLVKKFDKSDAAKVTETADFQKDLCLDSLDRVELVMAFEQEFSIEIPDTKADQLTCCADVAKFILAQHQHKAADKS